MPFYLSYIMENCPIFPNDLKQQCPKPQQGVGIDYGPELQENPGSLRQPSRSSCTFLALGKGLSGVGGSAQSVKLTDDHSEDREYT